MELVWGLYVFTCGLILGSFYHVAGLRLPKKQSMLWPRSHCSSCKKTLKAIDLFPVLSYLLLKGKCRHCSQRISYTYPLVELVTAMLFLGAWLAFGWSWNFAVSLLLISMLMIIIVSDLAYMLIPDKVLLSFAAAVLLLRISVHPLDPWWSALAGGAAGFLLLFMIAVLSKGGMGGGDIKLFGVLGLFFGVQEVILVFFLSVLFGALFGMLGWLAGKVKKGVPFAFGPYIAIASMIALFFGSDMIDWYIYLSGK
ncbi:type 4 prepilin peptidase 1 Aspartic peptidase. MEROPS family A24A [Alteribacillus persepolensis]|uniref:Prepilin leader peptidase/N-methyltransferase n=1 Tax=Alteribacillus persepolensis TaxID=568899 RepID=A0A1G8GQ30_9BACI|nr:A24 family peptidase [Alteribacillus persepolensis]SDH96371.1 type 4 prepilin peptidase 1 Aspartic peptidase. MEROPS family A24A [Alteribacillus persepolensis]